MKVNVLPKQFPVVRASGTRYEVGLTIGKTLQTIIQKFLRENKKIFEKDFLRLLAESKKFLSVTLKYFPQYIEELEGLAKGADVSFEELFLANNRELADHSLVSPELGHCTIVAVPQSNGYLVGHNEDWDKEAREYLYFADVTVNGTRIFGLNYAYNLIGDSVAVNSYGLIEAVNELYHEDEQVGVPKNFVARAILDCKTLEEVEVLMEKIPRASGFNHVLVQGKRLWNIESSAKDYVIEKIEGHPYAHTNHYVTMLKHLDRGTEESVSRYVKAIQLISDAHTVDDIKRLLSDRGNPRICRDGTIGSVIFDVHQNTVYIAYGQPSPESYVAQSLA